MHSIMEFIFILELEKNYINITVQELSIYNKLLDQYTSVSKTCFTYNKYYKWFSKNTQSILYYILPTVIKRQGVYCVINTYVYFCEMQLFSPDEWKAYVKIVTDLKSETTPSWGWSFSLATILPGVCHRVR